MTQSLLLTLAVALGIGVLLRRTGRLRKEASTTLNRVILDVTLPALYIGVLSDAELDRAIGAALLVTLGAQAVGLLGGMGAMRALGLPRPTQGAAGLTAGFANTGFLGVPVAIAVFGGRGLGPSTAILIDAFNTTVLMWTSGVVFARHMAETPHAHPPRAWRALATPLTAATVVGISLRLLHLPVPPLLREMLDRIGAATTPLVFLSLGISLELGALRGRLAALATVSTVKLVLAPLAAYGLVLALGLGGPIAKAAILQAAMPTAMLSAILAAESGCDGPFAAGVAVLTTLASTVMLPVTLRLLGFP